MNGNPTACQYAQDRYRDIARWRNLWTILLFVFGSALVVFLCAAVLLFIRANFLPGALTVLSTLVNGAAVKWVHDRRTEAVSEEKEAYQEVVRHCGGSATALGGAIGSVLGPPESEFRRWKLFGLFR